MQEGPARGRARLGCRAEEPAPCPENSPRETAEVSLAGEDGLVRGHARSGCRAVEPAPCPVGVSSEAAEAAPAGEGHGLGCESPPVLRPGADTTISGASAPAREGEPHSARVFLVRLPDSNPPCPICGDHVGKPSALAVHLVECHAWADVQYQCSRCERVSSSKHSILCHVPRCQGRIAEPPGRDWACDQCPASFNKKVGLSQHKRHVHPVTRNAERVAGSLPRVGLRPRTRRGCWSVEEGETLTRLDALFRGARNINQLIAAEMGSKTPKQISDKRRQLGLCPEQTTSGGDAESTSAVEEESVTPETEAQSPLKPPGKIRKILAQRARKWLTKGQDLSLSLIHI